ncbi:uncharacterized protein LOC127831055 [Dreissena polymorpha]|uniref:uncharacterized protein LOC127831055 n=1 Tax=Dreissena polymorpha TaxID=45954 RepID=UPI002264E94C|nr:uncharacterized protein LOC127831055 [Dreissena polymorpha]
MMIKTVDFRGLIQHMKDVLMLDIFNTYEAARNQLTKIISLEIDDKCITVEDEIEAREEILTAIKDLKCSIQVQQEGQQERDANIDSLRHQLANLASNEEGHIRQIHQRFREIESHMNKLRDEHMEANVKLQKHKAILENINESVTIQAADIKWIKKTLDEEFKPILKKNEANCEVLMELGRKIDLILAAISNKPGTSSYSFWRDPKRYLNGKIDSYFEPIQQHLRTYLGYEDLELTVDIYEEDFKLEAATDVNDDPCFAKQPSYSGSDANLSAKYSMGAIVITLLSAPKV